MDSREFVEELERANQEIMARMGREGAPEDSRADVPVLLRIALKNELEAFELAAHWIPTTPELDVKLGLARQVGDEAKHYRLLEARYRELGGGDFDPRQGGTVRCFSICPA